MQLTVYRLVQEALTNTLKHAGAGARAAVRLHYLHGELRVDVDDDGAGERRPPLPATRRAAACAGMRERVRAYGGDGAGRARASRAAGGSRRHALDARRSRMIRVLLVDDQALLRMGFRMILEAEPDIEVVGEAGDGAAGDRMTAALRPDVVLMDVRMPGTDGIEATAAITADVRPATRVLILTTFDLDEYVFAGLRAGASGFLLKDAPPADLLAAIRTVAGGEAVLAPTATRGCSTSSCRCCPTRPQRTARRDAAGRAHRPRARGLRPARRGRSNREIAAGCTCPRARSRSTSAGSWPSSDLRDRVQAVVLAYESGLIVPGG